VIAAATGVSRDTLPASVAQTQESNTIFITLKMYKKVLKLLFCFVSYPNYICADNIVIIF